MGRRSHAFGHASDLLAGVAAPATRYISRHLQPDSWPVLRALIKCVSETFFGSVACCAGAWAKHKQQDFVHLFRDAPLVNSAKYISNSQSPPFPPTIIIGRYTHTHTHTNTHTQTLAQAHAHADLHKHTHTRTHIRTRTRTPALQIIYLYNELLHWQQKHK